MTIIYGSRIVLPVSKDEVLAPLPYTILTQTFPPTRTGTAHTTRLHIKCALFRRHATRDRCPELDLHVVGTHLMGSCVLLVAHGVFLTSTSAGLRLPILRVGVAVEGMLERSMIEDRRASP